ncbi:right-handed parallel beta-helix repeat-containing protein [Chloroflexi bacterium TSY]|nr:right-handed parallel beta-helix repeat-containing protein [Chloroflexi bacterium TSY]
MLFQIARSPLFVLIPLLISSIWLLVIPEQTNAQNPPTEVSGTITQNSTWRKANSPYHITGHITIAEDVVLTVEAGTVVKSAGNGLVVNGRGQLVALGTQSEPIIFTSIRDDEYGGDSNGDGAASAPTPGSWAGLVGSVGGSLPNRLSTLQFEHVIIRYAGVGITAAGNLTLTNSTVESSSSQGVNIDPAVGELPTIRITNSTIRKNGHYALRLLNIPDNEADVLIDGNTINTDSGNSVYIGNSVGPVVLSNNDISKNGTMTGVGVYLVDVTPQLTSNTISGFQAAVGLAGGYPAKVPTYSGNTFSGNAVSGIVVGGRLTGGTWIEAGGYPHFLSSFASTITVEEGATLTIPAGTIIKSLAPSISFNARSRLVAIGTESNPIIFTSVLDDEYGGDSNGDGTATAPAPGNWGGIFGSGTGIGSVNSSTLQFEHVIVRYAHTGISASGNLTLTNSTIESNSAYGVYVEPASGESPTTHITNSMLRKNNGYALYLDAIPDDGNGALIDGSIISTDSGNSVYVRDVSSNVRLSNNNITKTGPMTNAGIWLLDATPQLSGNTISGFQTAVAIAKGYPTKVPTYNGNTFSGNAFSGVAVGGILTGGTWIEAGGYPHFFSNLLNVPTLEEGATLVIPPGTVIKSNISGLTIGARARLVAVGSESEPIIFTSMKDDEHGGDSNGDGPASAPALGDWNGIFGAASGTGAVNASTLQLEHVIMRYAHTGISTSGNLSFTHSTIESNFSNGLYLNPAANESTTASIINSNIRNNNGHAIYIESIPEGSRALIDGNVIATELNNGIYMADANNNVIVSNNEITKTGNQDRVGIRLENATPQLTQNTIRGFHAPVAITRGYPANVPTYSGNIFRGNVLNGILVAGTLTNGTWTEAGGHLHFLSNIFSTVTVEDGATLTIPAGTVIKSMGATLSFGARADLIAVGTKEEPIVFTSALDDEHGGDSNEDGSASAPAAGDWGGLIGSATGTGSINASTLQLVHAIVRYARTAISASGNLTLTDSTVGSNSFYGIYLTPVANETTGVRIQNSIIVSNSTGIWIDQLPDRFELANNAIYGNTNQGLNYTDSTGEQLDATTNWWGNATGPLDKEGNPTGTGNAVNGDVDYTSWLMQAPDFIPGPPPPTPPPIERPPSSLATADAYEDNDICDRASGIKTDGTTQEHNFHTQGDTDWLRFDAEAGQQYRIEVQTRANSVADVILEVYAECDGSLEKKFEETFTPGVRLDMEAIQNGPLYLKIANFDPDIFGDEAVYAASVRQLKTVQGAVILMEGRLRTSDRLQPNIYNVVQRFYQLFKESGYSDDDIYYMGHNETLPGYDKVASTGNLQDAITNWAVERVGANAPLTIYLMDHGGIDNLYIDEPAGERLNPDDFDRWLSELQEKQPDVKINVIIEACNSGSFIEGNQSISDEGRLIITSTNTQNVAYASTKGAHFSDRFLISLREGYGLSNSFWDAQYSVNRLYSIQVPWIDANGNGIPNEPADGAKATNEHDPGTSNLPADTWAPYIVQAEGPVQIIDGVGTVRAEVRDNKEVKRVWATIYAPSHESPESAEELVPEDVPIAEFQLLGNDIYSATYEQFVENGTYRIALFAEDDDGLKSRLMVLEVETGTQFYLPMIVR